MSPEMIQKARERIAQRNKEFRTSPEVARANYLRVKNRLGYNPMHMRGEFHPHWKGGVKYAGGYRKIKMPGHHRTDANGYVLEHVLVMERFLGRPLKASEQVHHKNREKLDNRIENLELFGSPAEHAAHHWKTNWLCRRKRHLTL